MSYNSKRTGQEVENLLDEIDNKVDKVDGKQLSTEDFTTALKDKLNSLNNYDDTSIQQAINTLRSDFNTLISGNTTTAIESFNEIIAFLDGVTDSESLDGIIAGIQLEIAKKQVELVSGVNIKTINGQSILGSGNIQIASDYSLPAATTTTRGGIKIGSGVIVDNTDVLHAKVNESTGLSITNNGIEIKLGTGLKVGNQNRIETNLKTINGQSIEGSGNIEIQGGGEGEDIRYFTDFTVETLMERSVNGVIIYEDASEIIDAARNNKLICVPFQYYEKGYAIAHYKFRDGIGYDLQFYLYITIDGSTYSAVSYPNSTSSDNIIYRLLGDSANISTTKIEYVSGSEAYINATDNTIYICGSSLKYLAVYAEQEILKGVTIKFCSNDNCVLECYEFYWANGVVPTIEPYTHYELSLAHNLEYGLNAVLTPFKYVE